MDQDTKRAVAEHIASLVTPYYEGTKPWSYVRVKTVRVEPCPRGNNSQCAIQSALRPGKTMQAHLAYPVEWLRNADVAKHLTRTDWQYILEMHDCAVHYMDPLDKMREYNGRWLRDAAAYLDHTWGTSLTPMLEAWFATEPTLGA